jgi:hypothetical protein
MTPFTYSAQPVTIDPGTYWIPRLEWSLADFTVTFPEGWTAQYGHVYTKHSDGDDELGFYGVVVDEIYADACEGSDGEVMEVGPSVDDLVRPGRPSTVLARTLLESGTYDPGGTEPVIRPF